MLAMCAEYLHESLLDPAGLHLDAKNVPGSLSALLVLETGQPFGGCFYLLPQYHVALDAHQGGHLCQTLI